MREDPICTDSRVAYIWTSTLIDDLRETWRFVGKNTFRVPIYLILIACHAPVIRDSLQLILMFGHVT